MINSLQVILMLPLVSIAFPDNALIVFTVLYQIFNFRFMNDEPMKQKIFNLPDPVPFNDQFNNYDILETYPAPFSMYFI